MLDGDGSCCYYGGSRLQNFMSHFFFSPPAIKDSNSTVPFLSCLFFLGRTGKNMNSLSPFYILCFFSLEYCIAFIRIISFSLNLKSLIITAQQDSSTNGPGTSDLYALSISKVSISSQYKMAFNFSFFLFLIQWNDFSKSKLQKFLPPSLLPNVHR